MLVCARALGDGGMGRLGVGAMGGRGERGERERERGKRGEREREREKEGGQGRLAVSFFSCRVAVVWFFLRFRLQFSFRLTCPSGRYTLASLAKYRACEWAPVVS